MRRITLAGVSTAAGILLLAGWAVPAHAFGSASTKNSCGTTYSFRSGKIDSRTAEAISVKLQGGSCKGHPGVAVRFSGGHSSPRYNDVQWVAVIAGSERFVPLGGRHWRAIADTGLNWTT